MKEIDYLIRDIHNCLNYTHTSSPHSITNIRMALQTIAKIVKDLDENIKELQDKISKIDSSL